MKLIPNVIIALVTLALSGCGTIMGRQDIAPGDIRTYAATRTDGAWIWACVSGNSIFQEKGTGMERLAGRTIVPLCFLVDVPVSLVTDTVMLPVDIYYIDWPQVQERRAAMKELEYQQSLTLEDRQRIREENLKKQNGSNQAAQATAPNVADPGR